MPDDIQQKLADVIKLQLETKADVEALGRKAVWMADRIVELEAALRPFAKAYRDLLGMGVTANVIGSLCASEITPQDFRRAAELIKE
jgi:hypothetical protein